MKNSYPFGLMELEFSGVKVSGTRAFDEKFYVLIENLWQSPDSGYCISTALEGLSLLQQRRQFQCQLWDLK